MQREIIISNEFFNPDMDVVYITGSILHWAEPGEEPEMQTMTRVDDSFVFTRTLQLEAGVYEYKYFLNEGWSGGVCEGGPNFEITVMQDMTLNDLWGAPGQQYGLALNLLVSPQNAGVATGEAAFLANAITQIAATPADDFIFVK